MKDLYGKMFYTFSYQLVIKTCCEVQRKDVFKRHFDSSSDFFTFVASLRSTEIFFKEIKFVGRYFQYPLTKFQQQFFGHPLQ